MMESIKSRKVAVIGTGAFGIAALRQLSQEADIAVVGFERRSVTGGMWNYELSPDTQPYLTPVYANLRTNSLRCFCEYPDKPFHNDSRWPDHKELNNYMQSYSTEFGLDQLIRFETEVVSVSVKQSGVSNLFTVKSRPIQRDSPQHFTEELFDFVVVAVGYYGKAVEPDIPGKEEFGGEILHSWRYRHPETYQDKRVLLIGSQLTAWDIAWDLSPHVTEVLVSHRQKSLVMTVPENGRAIRADVKQFTQKGVILENGETVTCDVVMYCTGYIPDFSFLDASCHTNVVEGRVENLYKMIVHTKVPGLFFAGLYNIAVLMSLAACQAKFIASVINGNAELPTGEKMEEVVQEHFAEHMATGKPPRVIHTLGYYHRDYCNSLERIGGFTMISSAIHSIRERFNDLAIKERKYVTMRETHFLEPIDDINFREIHSEN